MLGPLIYIIYVNDVLQLDTHNTKIVMYADDMLIISQNAMLNEMFSELQNNLSKMIKWCDYNKLTVNRDKTKCMLISNKKITTDTTIEISGQPLCMVSQYEYLGVILDKELKMVSRVDSMIKKTNTKLGILSRVRRYMGAYLGKGTYWQFFAS